MDQSKKDLIARELEWTYTKSSGPGGQHVNTTDSKAKMSWSFNNSTTLSARQKALIYRKLSHYIKRGCILQLADSSSRSRETNKKNCINKLFYLLENIAFKIEKKRIKTKPSRSSVEKRIRSKKQKADTKKNRQKVDY